MSRHEVTVADTAKPTRALYRDFVDEAGKVDPTAPPVCSAVMAAGRRWAVGLQWSAGTHPLGMGHGAATGEFDSSPRNQGACYLVRALSDAREQYALGYCEFGFRAGLPSLAAHIADIVGENSLIGLFRLDDDSYYLLAVQNGVVRPGTDVCVTYAHRDQLYEECRRLIYLDPSAWTFKYAPHDAVIPEVESTSIGPLLEAPITQRLSWLKPPIAEYMRIARRVAAGLAVAVVLWQTYVLVDRYLVARDIASSILRDAARIAFDEVDAIDEAPWEASTFLAPAAFLRACVDTLSSLRLAQSEPRTDVGPSDPLFANIVRCGPDGFSGSLRTLRTLDRVASLRPGTVDFPPPALVFRAYLWRSPERVPDPAAGAAAAQSLILPGTESFVSVSSRFLGAAVDLEKTELSRQHGSRRIAWARQRFVVKTPINPLLAEPWLDGIAQIHSLVLDSVSYSLWTNQWQIRGWIGGEADFMREVRAAQARNAVKRAAE